MSTAGTPTRSRSARTSTPSSTPASSHGCSGVLARRAAGPHADDRQMDGALPGRPVAVRRGSGTSAQAATRLPSSTNTTGATGVNSPAGLLSCSRWWFPLHRRKGAPFCRSRTRAYALTPISSPEVLAWERGDDRVLACGNVASPRQVWRVHPEQKAPLPRKYFGRGVGRGSFGAWQLSEAPSHQA